MTMAEFPYKDLIHRCFRCGYCKFPANWMDVNNCPPYARFRMETFSCGGRLWLTRAWLNTQIEWSEHLAEILYSCTTCRNCEIKCPLRFNVDIVNMVVAARSEMVESGRLPSAVKLFLENVELQGNPYGSSRTKRDAWVKGCEVDYFKRQEYLLYVGCTASYDTRAQKSIIALTKLFQKFGISFGILGVQENCDGNEVHKLGEEGLFETLAEKNIALFKKLGVSKIITFSPHAFNIFKNHYPQYGGNFNVFHYTQILVDLIKNKNIIPDSRLQAKICFHDPCYLGRWNNEYEAPREIIKNIPGVELVEMEKNRESALCCGGGAGNFQIDLLGGSKDSPSRRRVREAKASGANVLAVACPKCLVMLEDAIKSEELEHTLEVKDISEILAESCNVD